MNDLISTLLIVAICLIALGIYLAPTIVAFKRTQYSRWSILVLNLLAGYTLVGWLIALVWAQSERGGIIDSVGRVISWVCVALVILVAAVLTSMYISTPQLDSKPSDKTKEIPKTPQLRTAPSPIVERST